MLTSLALIFLLGLALGWVFKKLHLPALIGYLIAGIVLGPQVLGWLDASLLGIAGQLRQVALVIILTRAGLALDLPGLKKVGRPALLMCFVPATFELAGVLLLAPPLLGVSLLEAAVIGTVLAAVSPAVVVPRMLRLMETGYGTGKGIPHLIMAGASVDDVYVIVLFTAFTGMADGRAITAFSFVQVPVSIVLGLAGGIALGLGLAFFLKKVKMQGIIKLIIVLSLCFLLLFAEQVLEGIVPFSGLLAIISMSATLLQRQPGEAGQLSPKFGKLWVGAEVLLFALVGAAVDLNYALAAGAGAIVLIFGAMVFRMLGVLVCLIKTKLNFGERLFCMIAYTPKATVQAAIGAIPLAMGLPAGPIVLTVAVLAILITAPLGAIGIDLTYKRLLTRAKPPGRPAESRDGT